MQNKEGFKLLFICSGNSCRSPIAEGLMKSKMPEDLKDRVTVESAGTLGLTGNPATEFAVQVAAARGADIAAHRSQALTEELAKSADIIFAMAYEHKAYIDQHFPQLRENTFLLKQFGREPGEEVRPNIEDPIGRSYAVYEQTCELIDRELDRVWPRLESLIRARLGTEEQ